MCSHLGDNKEMFYFFFPLMAGLMNLLGVRILCAAILSEWSNLLLKWVYKGDRPYWWVQQTSVFSAATRPVLRQFSNTCETGPGTPSGHIMINVAIFYVVFRGLSRYFFWTSKRYMCTKVLFSTVALIIYVVWMCLIFLSRLYIQAHFIHQCVLGVFLGLVIGHISWTNKWLVKAHMIGSTAFAGFLFGSSLLVFEFLLYYGLDPLWSIPLARKYCYDAKFVHLNTQPVYVGLRFIAMAFGLGFALASRYRKLANNWPRTFVRTALIMKMCILAAKTVSYVLNMIPQDDPWLYYGSNFILQLFYPYLILIMVPVKVQSVWDAYL
ncbi:UNVERIFIED_CONTAM: hypothetical protein GTU68_033803 [Idotea baltica]|nr:hypothetical protein [Idotea baltica]